jgi:hypothetical protein
MIVSTLIALLIAAAPQAADRNAACPLLTADEIQAVQGSAVTARKGTEDSVGSLHVAQCVFTATEFARSVSVSVMTGDTRSYWEANFRKRPKDVPAEAADNPRAKKKTPPRPIGGTGDEAFWTGDDRAGSLYVLAQGRVLRVSVGGVTDEAERIRRSAILAGYALQRLR